ncbi:hypothetical protein NC651_022599 [Populus alba x Populus x berolinensis]|nr:hypothetical protein NC651_022599 [Populus alba x Populus x berolinensis]
MYAPVAQWIERLFPKQKVVGSTPTWRDPNIFGPCKFEFGPVAPSWPSSIIISENQRQSISFFLIQPPSSPIANNDEGF